MKVKDLYKRIASLTPEQRALLSRKMERPQGETPPQPRDPGQPGDPATTTTPVSAPAGLAALGPDAAGPALELPRERDEVTEDGLIVAPLSLMQQRLWVLDQMEPGNLAYSLPIMTFRLQGTFNPHALNFALSEVERRHEGLRTTFRNIDGQGRQVIHPPRPKVPLPIIDLEALERASADHLWNHLAILRGRTPFDLVHGPLWNCMLFRYHAHEHMLVILKHHIISDGWSMGVMYDNLNALYNAHDRGEPSPLQELKFQYRDFARWQRELFSGERLQREIDFWKQQLDGAPLILDLPTDRPRPARQTYNGHREMRIFDLELIADIHSRLQSEGLTGFIFMLAVWNAFLFRLTGRRDVLSGSPMAGRHLPGSELLLGFFVNTLVYRAVMPPRQTLRQLLAQLRERVLEIYDHRELPFDAVVKEVQPRRDPSYPPLVQAMFTVQNIPMPDLQLGGAESKAVNVQNHTSQVDLILFVGQDNHGRVAFGHMEHNTDLFDSTTAARWLEQFEVLTRSAVDQLDVPLEALQLLPKAQQHQLLLEMADARRARPLPTARHAVRLHELLEGWVHRTPHAIALVAGRRHLSYGSLWSRAARLAHYLQELGLRPEQTVAVYLRRRPLLVQAVLAVLQAGGAYLPLDPEHSPQRQSLVLADAAAPALLTESSCLAELDVPEGTGVLLLDSPSQQRILSTLPASAPPCPAQAGNAAYVIYTSGSTGQPKGVVIEHRGIVEQLRSAGQLSRLTPADASSAFFSFAFDFSIWELWLSLISGSRVALVSYATARSPRALHRLVREQQLSVLWQTPSAFRQLLAVERRLPLRQGLTSLRYLGLGAEALEPNTLTPWIERHGDRRPRIQNLYGPTEATICTNWYPIDAEAVRAGGIAPLGKSWPHIPEYVLDPRLRPVGLGIPGELCIGGSNVARGYLGRPSMTAAVFVPDAFAPLHDGASGLDSRELDTRGARLYRTGDLVRRLPGGELSFLGRIDHQVKLRGFRVELGEIEARLSEHAAVTATVVVVNRDEQLERLVAYVVLQEAEAATPPRAEDLRKFLRGTLPDYMVPALYYQLDTLPRTASDKVDRKALAQRPLPAATDTDTLLGDVHIAPRTDAEARLAEIWARALHLPRVSIDADFFELGGHSLLGTQVIAQIERAFGVDLPLRALFDDPTVSRLAARLEAAETSRRPPLVPRAAARTADLDAPLPLSFSQRRLWFLDQLNPGNAFYLMPVAWDLRGPLRLRALRRALGALVERHEILRTVYQRPTSQDFNSQDDTSPGTSSPEDTGSLENTSNEEPTQRVLDPARHWPHGWPLPLVDLRAIPDVAEAQASKLAEAAARRTFDLEVDPPLRTVVARLESRRHLLLLTQHHIASDGWSLSVLERDLDALYRQAALQPLAIQYADFALWQRQWLRDEVLDEQLHWWRRQLTDDQGQPPQLELPLDRPRPPVPSFRGGLHRFVLPRELRQRLQELAQRRTGSGTTLFMVMLAGFGALLGRYSGQDDMLIGAPIAGRGQAELDDLIGFFVNTLALRCRLRARASEGQAPAELSFEELLGRTRERTLGAFAHQDLPFERLVEELAPQRDLSRNPLFQVGFALQAAPTLTGTLSDTLSDTDATEGSVEGSTEGGSRLGDVEVQPWAVEVHTTHFDLELHLHDTPAPDSGEAGVGLVGGVSFDRALFDSTTIQRMMRHYRQLLEAAVQQPRVPLLRLPLLAAAEQHQLVREWSWTPAPAFEPRPLHQRVGELARQRPHAIAAAYQRINNRHEAHLSYAALDASARSLANALRRRAADLGVRLGTDVCLGLCVERSSDMVAAMLGILHTGSAYVPLDPQHPIERLRHVIEDSRMPLLLGERRWLDHLAEQGLLPDRRRALALEDLLRALTDTLTTPPPRPAESPLDPESLAYVIYTSGSTGRPKGVGVSHRAVCRLVLGAAGDLVLNADERLAQTSNIAFDAATWELWGALLHGATLVGIDTETLLAPARLATQLRERGVTTASLVTSVLNQVQSTTPRAFTGLRRLHFGAEAVDPHWIRRLLADGPPRRLLHMYGPTESTTFTTVQRVRRVAGDATTVSIGRPLGHTRVYVLDVTAQLQPIGIAGELFIGGAGLARGYLGRPSLTASKFVPDGIGTCEGPAPSGQPAGRRLYRTGDLVRQHAGGDIEFLGRIDQQVKVHGVRVELGEVEAALHAHPALEQVAVVTATAGPALSGTTNVRAEVRLTAFVVSNEGPGFPRADDLRRHLRSRVPEAMVPAAFVHLEALPLTPNGKLDRSHLERLARERQQQGPTGSDRPFEAPLGSFEPQLAELWAELLQVERVGRFDDFFDLGGHSLLGTRLAARVRQRFGVELPMRAIFEAPTLAAQARVLAGAGEAPPAIAPRPAGAAPVLSFAQQRMWFLDRLMPGNPFYLVPMPLVIRGAWRRQQLRDALASVITRHEVLRTRIQDVGGEPRAVLDPPAAGPVALPALDLRHLSAVEAKHHVQALLARDAVRPFDLASEQPWRATFAELPQGDGVLLLTLHHIATDAWSGELLLHELRSALGRTMGKEVAPPNLPVQYPDFAAWQRAWLQGDVLERQLAWWREQLTPAPAALELPTDRPRPEVQSYRGGSQALRLDAEAFSALEALTRATGSTLFMAAVATFAALLHRLGASGSRDAGPARGDVVIGTPVANRSQPEVQSLIGLFVNTLALRCRPADTISSRDLLRQVRHTILGAYAHQELPFEQLVEQIQPQRDLSRNPLFQVLATVHQSTQVTAPSSAGTEPPANQGVQLDLMGGEVLTTRFDLELHLWPDAQDSGGGLAGVLVFDRDLLDDTTARRWSRWTARLLHALAETPDLPLDELPLLDTAERHQLLTEWQPASTPPVADQMSIPLPRRVVEQARRSADAIAVSDGRHHLSYAGLTRAAIALAVELRRRLAPGLESASPARETPVVLLQERSIERTVATLGVLLAGAVVVPPDLEQPADRLTFLLRDSGARLALTGERLSAAAREALDRSGLPSLRLSKAVAAAGEITNEITSDPHPDQLFYVIYTSGSTGVPKGVGLPHGALANLIDWHLRRGRGADRQARTLLLSGLGFDASFGEIFATWCGGGTLLVPPEAVRKDPAQLVDLLRRWRVERMIQPFVALDQLARHLESTQDTATVDHLPRSLFWWITSGEQLRITGPLRRLFARLDRHSSRTRPVVLENQYGPSESHVITAQTLEAADAAEWPALPSIGRPIEGGSALVLAGDLAHGLRPAPLGAVAELYVGGRALARGYLGAGGRGRPALTADAFLPHPASGQRQLPAGSRLYRTGDLARHLADGRLEFLGRADHQVKVRGYRVEPGEIEAVLSELPEVAQAAVLAFSADDNSGRTSLAGYVVTSTPLNEGNETGHESGDESWLERIRAELLRRLPEYMVPTALVRIDELPRTASGKLDRRTLRERGWPLLTQRAGSAPRGELEQTLAAVWSDVLSVPQVYREDDFFRLGGHSLLATRVLARLRPALDVDVPLRLLFQHSTLSSLAGAIAGLQPTSTSSGAGAGAGAATETFQRPLLAALPRPLTEALALAGMPGPVPLSFAQERMWLLHRLQPDNTAYHLPTPLRLRGSLEPRRLHEALTALAARHEILRTTFPEVTWPDGSSGPAQAIAPRPDIELPCVDLRALRQGLVTDRSEAAAQYLGSVEVRHLFDLQTGPLLRTTLLRLANDDHALLLTAHHILTDGWSEGILLRELAALYQGASLPPLPIQYADFAIWQRQWLTGDELDRQLDWWRRLLAPDGEPPPPLELPVDRPRPKVKGTEGGRVRVFLPAPLRNRLEALRQTAGGGTTLFMVLLAGLQALLGRITQGGSQRPDVTIGTPIANRTHAELEDLVGFFVNTLALRASWHAGDGFLDLVRQARDLALGAYAHQDLPFERLVEALQPRRDLSRNPLFQVILALQNTAPSEVPSELPTDRDAETAAEGVPFAPGLRLGSLDLDLQTTRMDLELLLWPDGADGALLGSLFYDRDLFDATSARRLVEHFQTLLHAAIESPERPLHDLDTLAPAQRHQLLHEVNDTWSPAREHLPLFDHFVRRAAAQPATIAAVYGQQHLSYGTLARRARRIAAALHARTAEQPGLYLGPDVPVGICVERSTALVEATLGVLAAGATYVPLDPDYPAERLRFLVEDSRMPILLGRRALLDIVLPRLGHANDTSLPLGVDLEAAARPPEPARQSRLTRRPQLPRHPQPTEPLQRSADPHTLAYVIYTSGSTGVPKGVAVPQQAVARLVEAGFDRAGSYPGDNYEVLGDGAGLTRRARRIAQAANAAFDAATYELWAALLHGGTVVGIGKETLLSPPHLARALRRQAVDSLFVVTAVFHRVADAEPDAFTSLGHLHWGGEAVDPRRVRRILDAGPPRRLNHVYGPTENTTFTTWHPVHEVASDAATVPIGEPLRHSDVQIVDRRLHPVPLGVPGELTTGGLGLARGYLHRSALTAAVFMPHPLAGRVDYSPCGARLYRSGDLVRRRGDGAIEFVGRIDHQVKIRGFRVEPDEVAVVLAGHPELAQAAVLARPIDLQAAEAGRRVDLHLVAYVVPAEPANTTEPTSARPSVPASAPAPAPAPAPTVDDLRAWLGERLPEHLVPSVFLHLDALPLTVNGKLDTRALPLPDAAEGSPLTDTDAAPRDDLETILATVWAEVLHRPVSHLGIHDDFFDLGGHSLRATQVVSRVRQELGVELALRTLFENSTIAQLADALRPELALSDTTQRTGSAQQAGPTLQPVDRDAYPHGLPLSFGQRRLWFLEQIDAAGTAYHLPGAFALRGHLDVAQLARAAVSIVQRHEVLRSVYQGTGEAAVQVAHSIPRAIPLPVVDFSRLDPERRTSEQNRLSEAEARRPFTLDTCPPRPRHLGETSPVLRLLLLRAKRDEHALLVSFHHIASDGWSLGVFYRELTALYRAGSLPPLALPPLALQYGDYAVWQRTYLQGDTLQAKLDWWREQLDGAPARLLLPTDHPRDRLEALATQAAGRHHLRLDADLQQHLRRLARATDTTLFMVLLAALQLLLSRLSGQLDVTVGSPIAGRTHQETEALIGFFINSLVLRADLRPGEEALTFRRLLGDTRERVLGAYAHQDIPFEKLVEELNPERSLTHTPLFQVFFNLINLPPSPLELPGVSFEMLDSGAPDSKFDLNFYALEHETEQGEAAGLDLQLHYDAALFDAPRMVELLQRYEVLLRAVTADPATDLHQVPLRPPTLEGTASCWLEPAELEARLSAHPAVQAAAVVSRSRRDGSVQHLACVAPAPPPFAGMKIHLDPTVLQKWLREPFAEATAEDGLPSELRDLEIRQVETIPQLLHQSAKQSANQPAGQLPDRAAVLAALEAAEAADAPQHVAPRNDTERTLGELWQDLLERQNLSVHDDFFDLGGHSLLAGRLIAAIRDRLGVEVPMRALFEGPTIAEMAVRVEELQAQMVQSSEDDDLEALLAEIEDLEDDEVEVRLED